MPVIMIFSFFIRFCRLLCDILLPASNTLPRTYREMCAVLKDLGMEYNTIDACPNDHIIYYGQHASKSECPECGTSRYRIDQVTDKVPRKVLRHIPIIPRFQRLFRDKNIAEFMDYHARQRSEDGVRRMPADGSAFKDINERWPIFKEEPRNVRLSMAADGVNPFGELRTNYSVWPVFVINNNLPPWMTIKREHVMLALTVPSTYF